MGSDGLGWDGIGWGKGEERTNFFTSFCIRTVFLGLNREKERMVQINKEEFRYFSAKSKRGRRILKKNSENFAKARPWVNHLIASVFHNNRNAFSSETFFLTPLLLLRPHPTPPHPHAPLHFLQAKLSWQVRAGLIFVNDRIVLQTNWHIDQITVCRTILKRKKEHLATLNRGWIHPEQFESRLLCLLNIK